MLDQHPFQPASRSRTSSPVSRATTQTPRASVILSTYNQPWHLERAIWGYTRQSVSDFELMIADDGSSHETRKLIEELQRDFPVPLRHSWQSDDGFRKGRALNLAVLRARAPYLIFSDGDCIPARTFVADHLRAARPDHYVVGGHIRLTPAQTEPMTRADIDSGRFEELVSLPQRVELLWTHLKSQLYIAAGKRRKPKFYGLNFSVPRDCFMRVNGFDHSYRNSGRDDSDLRNRMQLLGMSAVSLWHKAGVFHLHHPIHSQRVAWKEAARYYNRPDLKPRAPEGIEELLGEAASADSDADVVAAASDRRSDR